MRNTNRGGKDADGNDVIEITSDKINTKKDQVFDNQADKDEFDQALQDNPNMINDLHENPDLMHTWDDLNKAGIPDGIKNDPDAIKAISELPNACSN